MNSKSRRRASKGRWMKLRDRNLLVDYMKANDFSQARLGRYAGVSRQFIHMLVMGDKVTCTDAVGTRIEEGLRVLPGTLFVRNESPVRRPGVMRQATGSRVA